MLGGYLGLRRQCGIGVKGTDFGARPWVPLSLAMQSWARYRTLCPSAFSSVKWADGGHLTGLV